MVEFYIVRHGQTVYNTKMILQGRCDSPLTEEGIKQAQDCRDYLKKIVKFDYVFSSPSKRACDTARIIIDNKLEIIKDEGLYERSYGIFDGHHMSREERDKRNFFQQDLHKEGGESYADVEVRVFNALKEITKKVEDGSRVLILSHGDAIYSLCHAIDREKCKREGVKFLNCSLTKISYDNGVYRLDYLPQVDYLEQL